MKQQLFVYKDRKPIPVTLRQYTEADTEALVHIQRQCFPPPFPENLWWNKDQIANHAAYFPEGALCVQHGEALIGSMTGMLVQSQLSTEHLNWGKVTDDGYISSHHPNGDSLYVVDISVSPAYRASGIGRLLMHSMYQLVVQRGLTRLLGGSRMPGYHRAHSFMTPEQYVDAVVNGEMRDPVISFLLQCGRTPVAIVPNYLDDAESCNYGLLMEWRNPFLQH